MVLRRILPRVQERRHRPGRRDPRPRHPRLQHRVQALHVLQYRQFGDEWSRRVRRLGRRYVDLDDRSHYERAAGEEPLHDQAGLPGQLYVDVGDGDGKRAVRSDGDGDGYAGQVASPPDPLSTTLLGTSPPDPLSTSWRGGTRLDLTRGSGNRREFLDQNLPMRGPEPGAQPRLGPLPGGLGAHEAAPPCGGE